MRCAPSRSSCVHQRGARRAIAGEEAALRPGCPPWCGSYVWIPLGELADSLDAGRHPGLALGRRRHERKPPCTAFRRSAECRQSVALLRAPRRVPRPAVGPSQLSPVCQKEIQRASDGALLELNGSCCKRHWSLKLTALRAQPQCVKRFTRSPEPGGYFSQHHRHAQQQTTCGSLSPWRSIKAVSQMYRYRRAISR
jgi:hypothetical protein